MSHTVKPVDQFGVSYRLPYVVYVDDVLLRNKNGHPRRFKDSFTATLAGTREVDRQRLLGAR